MSEVEKVPPRMITQMVDLDETIEELRAELQTEYEAWLDFVFWFLISFAMLIVRLW